MSNKNRNRGQFPNNRPAPVAANLEDDTTDKFEDDAVDFSGVKETPELFEPSEGQDLVVARVEGYEAFNAAGESIGVIGPKGETGPRGPARPAGYNYDGTVVTPDNDHRTEEDRATDEASTEEHPNDRVGDQTTSSLEESVEDEQGALDDEREFEENPENDQSHDDEEEPEVESEEPAAPVYPFSELETWTVEELENYISRPENIDVYHSKLVKAIGLHRQLFTKLNEAWSVDECTAFFKEGVEPAKTSKGCYVNDVTRRLRRESSWTTQELESWALGEIKPEGLVTTNGLAVQLHERFAMPINSVDPELVIAHYKHHFGPNKGQVKLVGQIPTAKAVQPTVAEAKVTEQKIKYAGLTEMNQTYIEETLKKYCDAVRPNRVITPAKGNEAQRELHNVVKSILAEQDPVGVKSGLDILFKVINEERLINPKGVFSDTNIFRFAEGISEVGREQEIHRRLFTLFFAFIDGDEGILAQTDVQELVKYLPSRQQNQLFAYFGRA
ncbi:hypothetical protein PHABIO_125 [Pseudomonas phage Phabio]|uniref:Virion structural protein n=1 Tax=Pseudomonas phage Phabio TaxID=2006668 RepID=A0A1Y0SYM9_9CAUD|nr:virion structural protein [Pseudomonas phage Phabio]ARV76756.1 hypothetical protein PHABIO_125 [Pseudomonas phage Phabio]